MSEIVHCPKCHLSVQVSPDQAGTRVQCPNCLKEFLAPSSLGTAGSTSEDDDWLLLDDSPPGSPASAPGEEVDEVEVLEEDDPFDVSAASDGAADLFADLPDLAPLPTSSSPASSSSGTAPAAKAPAAAEAQEEFRVKCPVCGTVMYARANQTGKTIKCSDCFSDVRVPKPPKKSAAVAPVEQAETFGFATPETNRPADPFMRSASDLLRQAEQDPDEQDYRDDSDTPSTISWIKSVFGIFLDPGVIIHFVGLSIFLAVPAGLAVAYPVLGLFLVPVALLGILLTVSCGFAILFGVANEHERIEDWPTVDPTGWFDSMWLVAAATAIAVAPAYIISMVFGAPPVITIGFVMFAVYAAFPIVLLSMLDMQSVMSPFSPEVGKSFTRCQEDWGAFYFSAGMLFAALFAYFVFSPMTPVKIGIGVVLSVAVVFMYFAMLGRLSIGIGEVVELSALDSEDDDEEEEES